MVAPYTPTPFATPVVNPAVGGYVRPIPYISCSQYKYAPTAMDVDSLVPDGEPQDQVQALADTILRASGWADRIVFGASPAGKGASLCASQTVESARVKVLQGELRLVCSYKPIIEVDGIDVGFNPSNVQPISAQLAASIDIGVKVITVPSSPGGFMVGGLSDSFPGGGWGRRGLVYAVWSYVNGYPHLMLSAGAESGDTDITVVANGPNDSLLGVYPGTTFSIDDWGQTENVVVESVDGLTITLDSPLINTHTLPGPGPDFVPVTSLPADVIQAVIFLTTALIKTRGDNSIVLDSVTEPKQVQSTADAVDKDVKNAFDLLHPFKSATKVKR